MSILTFVQEDTSSYTPPTGYATISTGATTLAVVSNRLTAPNDGARKVLRELALPPGNIWTATINLGFAQNSNPGINLGVGFFTSGGTGYATRMFDDTIHLHYLEVFNGVTSLDTDSSAPGADQDLTLVWDTSTGDLDVYLDSTLVCSANDTTFDETSGLRPGVYFFKFDGGAQAINYFETSIASSLLVSYIGDGGFELSGEATVEFDNVSGLLVDYIADGGFTLSGEATVEFVDAGALVDYVGSGGFALSGLASISSTVFYTGAGGFQLFGAAAIQNVPALPYSPNDRWTTNTPLAANFLYFRLLHQKNLLASRDSIGYAAEYPQNVLYNSATGVVTLWSQELGEEVLFTELGIAKLDVTFDQNARAVVVYEKDSEVWMYAYDEDTTSFTETKIANGTQPFVCWDERREEFASTGDVLVIYKRDNSVFMRRSRDQYLVEFATSLMNLANPFSIEGFGMTVTHRMQIRIRSTKYLEN